MFNVIVLGIASFLTDVSTEMVYPLLPLYLVTRLGASPALVGVIEGIAESTASLLKVYSGYVSDRIGRRKELAIAGYGSSTIGKVFLYFSSAWPAVLIGRVIDRFGKGVRTAPRDALIADSTPPGQRGRSFGLHRALDQSGAVIGAMLAVWFFTQHRGDYPSVFLASLVPAGLGVVALFFVREKRLSAEAKSARLRPQWSWSILPRRLKLFLLVMFLFTLGNSSNQFLLLRAGDLGMSPAVVLVLYVVYNFTYAAFSYPAGRLSDRVGRKWLLLIGYALYGLVYLGFALAQANQAAFVWVLFGIYGLYIGLTEGVEKAFVADMAPRELRATMIGLHATLVGVGLLPASTLAGVLYAIHPALPFCFGGAAGILAAVGLALVL